MLLNVGHERIIPCEICKAFRLPPSISMEERHDCPLPLVMALLPYVPVGHLDQRKPCLCAGCISQERGALSPTVTMEGCQSLHYTGFRCGRSRWPRWSWSRCGKGLQ